MSEKGEQLRITPGGLLEKRYISAIEATDPKKAQKALDKVSQAFCERNSVGDDETLFNIKDFFGPMHLRGIRSVENCVAALRRDENTEIPHRFFSGEKRSCYIRSGDINKAREAFISAGLLRDTRV